MNIRKYPLPDGVYDWLKWTGLVLLPALAVFVGTVGKAWGWPYIEPAVVTINALGVFIGALIGYSHIASTEVDDA